ncbi:hypothetical protein AHF37_06484 [Paragonimus kellicotti]|nr:hypothetical protein AHF37_06484 [Paragonimus kellicotti]
MHIQTNRAFLTHAKAPTKTLNDVSEVSQHSIDLSSQDLQDEQPTAKNDDDLGEMELTASLQKQTLQSEEEEESYDVRCPCRVNKDDGVMILCDGCGMWQHAVCFRILEEADVPTSHICEHCSESKPDLLEKGGITDSSLQGIAEDARRQHLFRTWAEASVSNTLTNDWNNSIEDSQESLLSPAPAKKKRRTGIANTPVAVARR